MIYRVIKAFADSKDEMHVYQPGDIFRADNTSAKRLAQLMTSNNMVGCPLIVAEQEAAKTVEPEEAEISEVEEQPEDQPEEAKKPTRKRGRKNAD